MAQETPVLFADSARQTSLDNATEPGTVALKTPPRKDFAGVQKNSAGVKKDYYGSRMWLQKAIPYYHTDTREVIDGKCISCHQGPVWQEYMYCCSLCKRTGNKEHDVMCSRNLLVDCKDYDPRRLVRVTMGFLRQLARSKGNSEAAFRHGSRNDAS